MLPIRIKACSESDLRMLGDLAHNIQRVLPVTQADIDAAAALGKEWVVWKVIEVTDPIDNLRGGTQLVIKQNSILPGQNVRRVLIVQGPGGQMVVVGPAPSPLLLPDAIADSLQYVKAFGGTEQRDIPDNYLQRQFIYMMDGSYLLTDIVPTYDCKIEMDFQTTSLTTASTSFLGGRAGISPTGFVFGCNSSKQLSVSAFSSSAYSSDYVFTNNTRYKMVFNNKVFNLTSGGSTVATYTFSGTNADGATLAINGNYNGSSGTIGGNAQGIYLYSFKVWNGQGELVADYVPAVQKGTVPVVGFYDTVSKTFKTATAGTFAAGGEAVPTPDAPMDIVSNNGVLKARHQSGLPLGYTLLESATGYSNQSVIDTGVAGNNNNLRIVFKGYKDTNSGYTPLIANYVDESSNVTRIIAGSSAGQVIFNLNRKAGSSDNLNGCSISDLHTYELYKTAAGVTTIEVDGVVAGTSSDSQGTENATNISLGNSRVLTQEPSTLASTYWYFYFCKIYDDGVLIRDYVPVKRNSDNVVGIYDLVNNTFDAGQYPSFAPFSAGNVASDPVEVYTDGTVETIEDTIGNTATTEMLLKVGDYQDVQSIIDGVVTRNIGVKVLDGTENWMTGTGGVWYNFQGDVGAFNTTTMICSHYSYAGAQVNIVDMSQNQFSSYPNGNIAFKSAETTSADDFKTWLADKYNAGTPVMVVYAKTNPATESVTGQTLQVQAGDNTLEITQASLSGLELEAEYEKTV